MRRVMGPVLAVLASACAVVNTVQRDWGAAGAWSVVAVVWIFGAVEWELALRRERRRRAEWTRREIESVRGFGPRFRP